jgi:chromosome segregation ATPase
LNRDARHCIFSLLEPHHWLQAAEPPGPDGPDEKKRRRTLSSKLEPENPVWATRIVKTATRLEELDRGISDTDRRLKIIDADEKDLRQRLNNIPKRRAETIKTLEEAREERKKTLTELAEHVTKIK